MTGHACACMGPQGDKPFCPCEMELFLDSRNTVHMATEKIRDLMRYNEILSHLLLQENTNISRFEVITPNGREYVRGNVSLSLSHQDDGKTLKIFLDYP